MTHEVTLLDIMTALNLTALAPDGALPVDYILPNHTFVASRVVPFATRLTIQVVHDTTTFVQSIRFILNDAVVPITNYAGCSYDANGFCQLDTVISALQTRLGQIDYNYGAFRGSSASLTSCRLLRQLHGLQHAC